MHDPYNPILARISAGDHVRVFPEYRNGRLAVVIVGARWTLGLFASYLSDLATFRLAYIACWSLQGPCYRGSYCA